MPRKTKKSKTKSGKKTAKNPCRVIRVKRKTGKSKLDRVVYARRKVCFNPDLSSVSEKLKILLSSKDMVTVQMENVRDFMGIIKTSREYKGWFRVTNPITYRFIYFNISNVLSINETTIQVDNYLINTTPNKRSHLTLL